MKLIKDSYGLLGVQPGVGTGPLRRAFRRAAAKCHPDLAPVSSSEEFIRLRKAFNLALGYEQGNREGSAPKKGQDAEPEKEDGAGNGGKGDPAFPDLVLTLELSPSEALLGLETVVSYNRQVPCRSCRAGCPGCRGASWIMAQGSGPAKGFLVRRVCPVCRGRAAPSCPACLGSGRVEEQAQAHLLVPARANGSEILVIPGLGHQTLTRTGDLILQVALR